LYPEGISATGKTLSEKNEHTKILNSDIMRHFDNLYDKQGVLSVLYDNLDPKGAVIKVDGVDLSINVSKGKEICYDSHDEAVEAIDNHVVREGNVVVIRYEGPKGGPGMPEMLAPTSSIRKRVR